jgi:hypothetical protein
MVDPEAIIIAGGSAPLALKMLGPTADYVGEELQHWTERRVENVRTIFRKAELRLGEKINEPGGVPPRVLREVLDGGSYWDDELGAEYFGGLLASSRSELSLDDRAASLAALVGRLSSYQLRSHYVLYAHAQRLLAGSNLNLGITQDVSEKGLIYMPATVWFADMNVDPDEIEVPSLLQHCIFGLKREDLLGDEYASGSRESLEEGFRGREFGEHGHVYCLSMLGVELFCFAHGVSGYSARSFFEAERDFSVAVDLELSDGARLVHQLPTSTG